LVQAAPVLTKCIIKISQIKYAIEIRVSAKKKMAKPTKSLPRLGLFFLLAMRLIPVVRKTKVKNAIIA